MDPKFLGVDDIATIHKYQIERYGGAEGVRDWNLLRSAVATPAACFGGHFLHADLAEMAAAYLFHLVQNHPFVDGNKRVGAATAAIFLEYNGLKLTVDADQYADLVISVASGKADKLEIARFFRAHVQPR